MTVEERLSEIHARITEVAGDVREIKASCIPCQVAIAKHDLTLYGNSHDGLTTRVKSLEDTRRLYRWGMRALWGVVSGLVLAGVSLVIEWIKGGR